MRTESYNQYCQIDYLCMTPQERNTEMCNIFAFIPPLVLLENIGDTLERRTGSELKIILLKRLGILLAYSYITKSAKKYILSDFKELLIDGLEDEDKLDLDVLYGWYSLNSGIFDKHEAPMTEQSLYQEASAIVIDIALHSKLPTGYTRIKQTEIVRERRRYTRLLKNWRTEYIQKYKDEP